ncbi:hypothetical protein Bpla01_48820 [Burkholderia plantarii]|nr:hypothetical protein Bpla01_48820 [Burkholderia plantarii]
MAGAVNCFAHAVPPAGRLSARRQPGVSEAPAGGRRLAAGQCSFTRGSVERRSQCATVSSIMRG